MDDNDLAKAAAKGDRGAFEALVRAHYDALYRSLIAYLRDPDQAADVLHDVLTQLPRKLKSFEGRSSLKTWLHAACINRAKDALRSVQLRREREGQFAQVATLTADVEWSSSPTLDALHRLDEPFHSTAFLVAICGATAKEAATILDCSPGTVHWRMSEVRTQLQTLIGDVA